MKKAWLFLADRFDALKPRERLAIFLALAAALVGLFFVLALNPAYARIQQAQRSLEQSEQALAAARAGELALLQRASLDPDAETRRLIAQVSEENDALRGKLASTQAQLASPGKMTEMLRDLIAAQQGVELVSMHTAVPEDLLSRAMATDKSPAARPATTSSLYRHAIELSVRGDYQALAGYLRRVESLPWKIELADMSLKAGQYPQATMTLTLYTLSLERTWLSF